jgi:hypothetical protein
MALRVLFLPLSGSGWTTYSSSLLLLLLLLMGEFTSHMSLSESSLQVPTSESESFKISLILSVLIIIFCEVFSALQLGPGFSMCFIARETSAK